MLRRRQPRDRPAVRDPEPVAVDGRASNGNGSGPEQQQPDSMQARVGSWTAVGRRVERR
ncbi:MAG TPA: hypothetical protein VKR23_08135 [Gaiellaceae bacterium]|nr:hypothetical protein [Gaiellaceae bacterium]